jgi:LmbE family N-acetylglucosaminyl deacetylase
MPARVRHLALALLASTLILAAQENRPADVRDAATLFTDPARPADARPIPPIDDPANLMGERVAPQALADTLEINHGAPALQQLLRKLRTRASMMLIVAHPDDEDGGLLTFESRGEGARVAMLTLTRGEGGQNLMSADFNDALGLIRTQELLAEDRYTGVDQFFGTEVDFGFSKTKEETLKQWGYDRVLYDAVRAVRLYRPLVLASVFIGGVTDGHGHHQVAGEVNQEVFKAAADPNVFPEMGLPPWAPLRVYARVPFAPITAQGMFDYATGKYLPPHFHNYVIGADTTKPPKSSVLIHEGDKPDIPAFHGMSYIQWARQGLALQKTQIGANFRIPPAGAVDVGYTLMGHRAAGGSAAALPSDEPSLFDGIDVSLASIADLAPAAPPALRAELQFMDTKFAEAQKLYDPANVVRTAPPLHDAMIFLDSIIQGAETSNLPADQKFNLLHELRVKRVQLNDALVLALGITLEPMFRPAHETYATPLTTTEPANYNVRIQNSGSSSFSVTSLTPVIGTELPNIHKDLPPSESDSAAESDVHFKGAQPTRPYFSRPNIEQPYYDIAKPALRNAPATPDPLISLAKIEYQGIALEVRAVVPDAQTVALRDASPETLEPLPVRNRVAQAEVFVPPIGLTMRRTSGTYPFLSVTRSEAGDSHPFSSQGVLPLATSSFQLGVSLDVQTFEPTTLGPGRVGPDKIPVRLTAPKAWQVSPPSYNKAMEPVLEHFTITPDHLKPNESYVLSAAATYQGQTYTEGYRPVGYPGLTYTNYYTPATYKATAVDVTTASNLRIAYLPGTGDDVPAFLPSLGVTPVLITTKDLTLAHLQPYDAVVLGVRAYSAHPELQGGGSAALNEYAKHGGVVIAQYMSAGFDPASAPFPFTVPGDSAHNVVDEDDPVTLLAPQSPLLTWPNQITSADFNQWIEERGHGFASSWSPEYQPLLETHDPEQDPQKGGLLLAKVGKGAYVYCAFALYRQLPEGVPGAYRLFANLLSYAKNPGR